MNDNIRNNVKIDIVKANVTLDIDRMAETFMVLIERMKISKEIKCVYNVKGKFEKAGSRENIGSNSEGWLTTAK